MSNTLASLGAQKALQEDFAATMHDTALPLTPCRNCGALGWILPCSECGYPTEGERANPNWAYRDANGKLLRGPCHDPVCAYASDPGGEPHAGRHSWQDGTTGYAHDFGQACDCPDCGGIG